MRSVQAVLVSLVGIAAAGNIYIPSPSATSYPEPAYSAAYGVEPSDNNSNYTPPKEEGGWDKDHKHYGDEDNKYDDGSNKYGDDKKDKDNKYDDKPAYDDGSSYGGDYGSKPAYDNNKTPSYDYTKPSYTKPASYTDKPSYEKPSYGDDKYDDKDKPSYGDKSYGDDDKKNEWNKDKDHGYDGHDYWRHKNETVVTSTKVVSQYTTYCPEPTTVTINSKKYTVTKATTLTITDCPCTIVEPCETDAVKPPYPPPPPPPKGDNKPAPPAHGGDGGKPAPPPPVVISGAANSFVHIGAAVFGALLVGVLAL
jgi:hypothetical protein